MLPRVHNSARVVAMTLDASLVHCLRGFCVRIMHSKFLFRSLIRGYLINIITRVDVWHPGNK